MRVLLSCDTHDVQVRLAVESDRAVLAAFAARLQVRPDRHIGYLACDAATIAEEMVAEDDDWTAASVIAERDGRLIGWLMGSVDADMGRVWWFGPFVDAPDTDWAAVAGSLYHAARDRLPAGVTEQEMAVDPCFEVLTRWAAGLGFRPEEASAILVLDPIPPEPASVGGVRRTTADDVDTVGRLHDEIFPGTHTAGARLVAGNDETHVRLALDDERGLVGYVAVERQPDGGGYIDFLGVAPDRRREGHGSRLIRAGLAALAGLGCERASLTVRQSNVAARNLYRSLGFVEERVLVPLRSGFAAG